MKAVSILPASYARHERFDLSKNRAAAFGLTAVGALLLLPIGWLVLRFLAATRPNDSFEFQGSVFGVLLLLFELAVLAACMVLAHESIHGLGFWAFTRERPRFGFRSLYAYAAAPDWYIPRAQYLAIGLAPLVVITVIGLVLLLVVPSAAIPALGLVVVLNAAGSIGDVAAIAWLLTRPRKSLVCDEGDAITIYQPT